MRNTRSPSRTVTNLSSVSIICSRLKVTTSYASALNDASSAVRAPASSPVRSRWMPRSACGPRVRQGRAPAPVCVSADRFVEAVVVRGQLAGDAVDARRTSARSPAPWRLPPRIRAACLRRRRCAGEQRVRVEARRVDRRAPSAAPGALRRGGRRRRPAARGRRAPSTEFGLISSAAAPARPPAAGSRRRASRPSRCSAGTHFGSICSAAWNDFSASPCTEISRGTARPMRSGWRDRAARRRQHRGRRRSPRADVRSARSARRGAGEIGPPFRASAVAATFSRMPAASGLPQHVLKQAELQRRLAFGQSAGDRPQQCLRVSVFSTPDRGASLDRGDLRLLRVEAVGERRRFFETAVDKRVRSPAEAATPARREASWASPFAGSAKTATRANAAGENLRDIPIRIIANGFRPIATSDCNSDAPD